MLTKNGKKRKMQHYSRLNARCLIMSLNTLLFTVLISVYLLQNSSPYKEQINKLFIKYFRPDQCTIKPWAEKKYNIKQWKNNEHMPEICMLPEFIEKNIRDLSALGQFMLIQFRDPASPVYMNSAFSSTLFGTDTNVVLLGGNKLLYYPKEIYTNTTGKIECTNMDFDKKQYHFTTRRPLKVSYLDEKFHKQEADFYSGQACYLADYFN